MCRDVWSFCNHTENFRPCLGKGCFWVHCRLLGLISGSWVGQQDSRVTGDGTLLSWPEYNFILILRKQCIQENHTHALKHSVARRLKVTCTVEGKGGDETLYIENLNWFQESGFTQQYIVFSAVWSVSLVSWLPYRGNGSFHKALGGWGICILWRNLNSIFCSVTSQSAYSVRPCIKLSFLFLFSTLL